ncbi:MAG: DUF2914 domain-containing protein [Desulfatiglandaceae bacterium]|jgi:hypothetical protein
MYIKNCLLSCMLCWLVFGVSSGAFAQKDENVPAGSTGKKLTLTEAGLCEDLKGNKPINRSVVFSKNLEKIYCFTSFDPVPEEMPIFHKWFQRDVLKATAKLVLKPPRWTTFSSMRPKDRDQGPWRVEITDQKGRLLKILRFSVTD